MMLLPAPGVLDRLIQERQARMRTLHRSRAAAPVPRRLRVRIGHALIVAGNALSGERVERPARPSAAPCG